MTHKNRLNKHRYITGFDGIRTIAVVGVILYHLFPTILRGGYLGVPIFFVLSGYLITDLLRQEWLQNENVDIKEFYGRRMKRLYPGLIAMLAMATAYITFFQPDLLNNLRNAVVSSLLYYNNWWQIFRGFSYFDRFSAQSPFTHIWSLAVEAQYYLIWPLAFIGLKKYVKKRFSIFSILLALSVLSALLMAFLYIPGADPTRVYYGTDTRLFSITLGSALAFVWPSFRLKEEIPDKARKLLNGVGIISLAVLGGAFLFLADYLPFIYYGGMLIVSIFSVALVAVTAHPGADVNRWLTNPVFNWVGKRSYGIYLYQFPVMIFYEAKVKNLNNHLLLHSFIELMLILGISELSYRLIEKPWGHFQYNYTWYAIKDFAKKPFITVNKVVALLMTAISCIAIYGLAIAPNDQVTPQQKQLQEKIAENKKKVEEQNKNIQEENNEPKQTEDPAKYTLTEKELEKAKNMEITAFGDSVILDAAVELQGIFPKMVVSGEVGRQLYSSTPEIDKLKSENRLKATVLVGLGTNGSFTEAQFSEFMTAIGAERHVYWVNTRVPTRRWQNEVNNMLKGMEKNYPNLKVIDWYSYSNAHEEWFYEDQVHPNVEGSLKYSEFISKAIIDATK